MLPSFMNLGFPENLELFLEQEAAAFNQPQFSGCPWNSSPKVLDVLGIALPKLISYPGINGRINSDQRKWLLVLTICGNWLVICGLISTKASAIVLRLCQSFNRIGQSLFLCTVLICWQSWNLDKSHNCVNQPYACLQRLAKLSQAKNLENLSSLIHRIFIPRTEKVDKMPKITRE